MPAGDDDRKYIDAFENENVAYRPGNKVLWRGDRAMIMRPL